MAYIACGAGKYTAYDRGPWPATSVAGTNGTTPAGGAEGETCN